MVIYTSTIIQLHTDVNGINRYAYFYINNYIISESVAVYIVKLQLAMYAYRYVVNLAWELLEHLSMKLKGCNKEY